MAIVVPSSRRSERESLSINLTPMVDVIFMLTIFYMLVSTFSSDENKPLALPEPTQSQASPMKDTDRLVVNCQLADPDNPERREVLYSIGPNRPEPLSVIRDRLLARKAENVDVKVILRADRRIQFHQVRALMRVLAESDIELLNVAAHLGDRGS